MRKKHVCPTVFCFEILHTVQWSPKRFLTATKEVLVCFGECKCPITLANDASVDDLNLCVVREYSDVILRSSSATDEGIASSQVKSEDWEGVFDVKPGDKVVD